MVYEISTRSEDIKELAAALSKAQGAWGNAPKNKVNPHLKSHYADLASIMDTVRKPLSDNGLSIVQIVETGEKSVTIFTELLHTSSQFIRGKMVVPAIGNIQQIGAAITYGRRYAVSSMLGIASDEEDDGESSKPNKDAAGRTYKHIDVSGRSSERKPKPNAETAPATPEPAPTPEAPAADPLFGDEPATKADIERVWARCRKLWPTGTTAKFQETFPGIESLKSATMSQIQQIEQHFDLVQKAQATF